MAILLTFSLVFLLWAGPGLAAECAASAPIALPITDTPVDPDIPDSLMRGIPAKIGTPPQNIVVLPWPDLNNTYIYDEEGFCDPSIIWNDKICEIRRGGFFLDTDSETFSKSSDLVAAGGATQEITTRGTELGVPKLLSTSLAGTERFAAGPTNFTTMPIGIPRLRWDHSYTILHTLGLGSNSTYLNALVQAGQIPSRVWSLFWGRMWSNTAIDGSLVLGGYDGEKVIGQNMTLPLDYSEDTGCWTGMKVTVSNVLVNFRNGTDYSLMSRNSAVQCCITPQRQLVWEAPLAIVDGFEEATGMKSTGLSFGLHWGARQYNTSGDIFDGDITFVLSAGLQIRVPNDQLLTPFVEVARNGSRLIHQSKRELLMGGVGDDNPAALGRYFFTAAYLMVDHDAHTFTMWRANPSTKSSLVPVVSSRNNGDTSTGDCSSSREATGQDNNFAEGDDATPPSSASSISSGAIVGAAVGGGVLVLGLLAALIFFLLRRRRRQATNSGADSPREKVLPEANPNEYAEKRHYYYHNNAAGISFPAEVAGRQHQSPRELDGASSFQQQGPNGRWTNGWAAYELDGTSLAR